MSGQPAPPPQPCGQGMYWDNYKQQCVSSGQYPPPQPCGQGMYWDQSRQQCVQGGQYPPPSGSQPPPQPCPQGMWWDHYQQRCMSGDGQGGQPQPYYGGQPQPYYGNGTGPGGPEYRDECMDKMQQVRSIHEGHRGVIESKMHAFNKEFAQARMEFSKARHTGDEWRLFQDEWMVKGQAIGDEIRSELEAKLRAALGECFDRLPPMPPMGPMFGGPGGPGDPGGPFGPGNGPGDRPQFSDFPPPPGSEGDHRFEFNEKAEEIRMECESRVRELIGPPPEPMTADGTRPMPPPQRPDPETERKAREIWRECEKKIRAMFAEEHKQDDVEDMNEHFGSLDMFFDEEAGRIIVQGKFLALQGNPESQMMEQFTCDGALFIDQLFVNGLLSDFTPEETGEGTALMIYDSSHDRVLGLHDNPRCVINLRATSEIPSITVDLADHLELTEKDNGDIRFTDGEVDGVILLHGAEVEVEDGNVVVIDGKATFLVKRQAKQAEERLGGEAYEEAIEDKKVGAEVSAALQDGEIAFESTPMGDLEVNVTGKKDQVLAIIDSESGEGKTVVLEFDREVFSSPDLEVIVKGFEDGEEYDLRTKEASDLEDVLDPLNDGQDTVEYWIVQDKNGFHVLVSFPHFSEKRVTIQGADAKADDGKLVPGFEAVLGMLAIAAVLIVVGVRRRRSE